MKPRFIIYRRFNDPVLADELAKQLELHDVPYIIEEDSLTLNLTFMPNDPFQKDYVIKIKSEDFDKVNGLLKDDENEEVNIVNKDYYLFGFSNDELMEVIAKEDEWSAFDVVLARKLLKERGQFISDETIDTIHKKRIEELKKPEASQSSWIIIGYMFALLGGILGIFIGWHLFTYKKTLPNGERIYDYNDNDRKQGKRIFYLSIIVFVLASIYKLAILFP